ncbi:MAG: hypothetical protein H5U01_00270 [Clostridia bacterium]|nr:hypothetical protein [Clostridia bacterium]
MLYDLDAHVAELYDQIVTETENIALIRRLIGFLRYARIILPGIEALDDYVHRFGGVIIAAHPFVGYGMYWAVDRRTAGHTMVLPGHRPRHR